MTVRSLISLAPAFFFGTFMVSALADDRELFVLRLQAGYALALDPTKVVEARWTMFAPSTPLPASKDAEARQELRFRDPFDNSSLVAVRFFRAWVTGGDKIRIEQSNPTITGGPESLRWSVWTTDSKFHVHSETLRASKAALTPATPLDPAVDDLFDDREAQCLGVVVFRLIIWMNAPGSSVESPAQDICVINTRGGPVRVEWEQGSNRLRSVRYRLKSAPKELVVEYFGEFPNAHLPMSYPAGSRLGIVDPGTSLTTPAHVYRMDAVAVNDETSPNRYGWQSIAAFARRTDTHEILRPNGEVDPAKTFANITQQSIEPLKHTEEIPTDGSLPKAIENAPLWSRWLLVGGITSLALACGTVLQRRMRR